MTLTRWVAALFVCAVLVAAMASTEPASTQPAQGTDILTEVPQEDAPHVVAVFPARGSEGVNPETTVRIRFDRPMDPLLWKITWHQGGFVRAGEVSYDEAKREFAMPLRFKAGTVHRIILNEPTLREEKGFTARNGSAAARFRWEFTTADGKDEPATALAEPVDSDPAKLQSLLREMIEAREKVRSLTETVSVLSMRPQYKQPVYGELSAEKAVFRMEGETRFYGDVSTIMNGTFRIGSDGQTCWRHFLHPQEGPRLTTCAVGEMNEKNVSLCMPFGRDPSLVTSLIEERGLCYEGQQTVAGRLCHSIARRTEDGHRPGYCTVTRWRIDAETLRPVTVDTDIKMPDFSMPLRHAYRFTYEHVNEDLPDCLFQVPEISGVPARPAEPLEEGYQKRFLNVIDGSQGRMSVRWGMQGTKGTSSSGLN